jgi:cytoskeletal protein CcmA (bactofilin family)
MVSTMLSDFKRKNAQSEAQSVFADGRQSEAGASKRPARPDMPSLISADVCIKGSLTSAGEVQFDGEIEGDLKAAGLVIGQSAKASGTVTADRLKISGTVKGIIRAGRVSLASTAVVDGELIHNSLEVEDGARLEGKVCRVENPVEAAAQTPLSEDRIKAELAEQPNMRGVLKGESAPVPPRKDEVPADSQASGKKGDEGKIPLSKAS